MVCVAIDLFQFESLIWKNGFIIAACYWPSICVSLRENEVSFCLKNVWVLVTKYFVHQEFFKITFLLRF